MDIDNKTPLRFERSAQRIAEHSRWVAGGVNSHFRQGMQPGPLVFERGELRGAEIRELLYPEAGPWDAELSAFDDWIALAFAATPGDWPELSALAPPQVVLGEGADVVALVKPQFEAGRAEVGRKGVVRDPAVQARVVEEAGRAAAEVGLLREAMTESPITGDTGNREFFLHLRSRR